jgi:histidinol-phosphatase (PHP family)
MGGLAAVPLVTPVPDRHVHTEWSWDAAHGDMVATCARAVALGLPAIALTEHADYNAWVNAATGAGGAAAAAPGSSKDPGHGGTPATPNRWTWSQGHLPGHRWPVRVPVYPIARGGDLDIAGYWEAIDRCRAAFPDLRIESGVELGEPNLYPDQCARLLAHRPLDRVLGSMHIVEVDGEMVDISVPEVLSPEHAKPRFRRYLVATRELVESGAPFAILTHLDYPKRYWPHATLPFDERDFEEEYRAVLVALARSGRTLEVNSSRAMGPPRGPCPGPLPLRWWHEAGGQAISFGSDAHRPEDLAAGLGEAADLALAAGFRPGDDPVQLWGRA